MSERYGVTADGQRFLIHTRIDDEHSKALTVVANWTAALTAKR